MEDNEELIDTDWKEDALSFSSASISLIKLKSDLKLSDFIFCLDTF